MRFFGPRNLVTVEAFEGRLCAGMGAVFVCWRAFHTNLERNAGLSNVLSGFPASPAA